jgi:dUTP pyrophosphatase
VEIKVKRLHSEIKLPTKSHPSDSGWDLYSSEFVTLEPKQTVVVKTGLFFQLPKGHEMQVRPRSGVSSKTSLRVIFGTIDSSYRGEVGIIVENTSNDPITIPSQFKIAQGVLCPVIESTISEVLTSDDTVRGDKGFGSTGV